jgi:hypothetical protein
MLLSYSLILYFSCVAAPNVPCGTPPILKLCQYNGLVVPCDASADIVTGDQVTNAAGSYVPANFPDLPTCTAVGNSFLAPASNPFMPESTTTRVVRTYYCNRH